MWDKEKRRIRQLNGTSDYSLASIHVLVEISAKKLIDAISEMVENDKKINYQDHRNQASNIIVATMSGQVLWVVRAVIDKPDEMIEDLNEHSSSRSTAPKIV